jgi:hypothetical protein
MVDECALRCAHVCLDSILYTVDPHTTVGVRRHGLRVVAWQVCAVCLLHSVIGRCWLLDTLHTSWWMRFGVPINNNNV